MNITKGSVDHTDVFQDTPAGLLQSSQDYATTKDKLVDTYNNLEVDDTQDADENRVIITGSQNDIDGDLINCGEWLERQKYGTFTCQNCGKEFYHYK